MGNIDILALDFGMTKPFSYIRMEVVFTRIEVGIMCKLTALALTLAVIAFVEVVTQYCPVCTEIQ